MINNNIHDTCIKVTQSSFSQGHTLSALSGTGSCHSGQVNPSSPEHLAELLDPFKHRRQAAGCGVHNMCSCSWCFSSTLPCPQGHCLQATQKCPFQPTELLIALHQDAERIVPQVQLCLVDDNRRPVPQGSLPQAPQGFRATVFPPEEEQNQTGQI